jgi:hypothetical protein
MGENDELMISNRATSVQGAVEGIQPRRSQNEITHKQQPGFLLIIQVDVCMKRPSAVSVVPLQPSLASYPGEAMSGLRPGLIPDKL